MQARSHEAGTHTTQAACNGARLHGCVCVPVPVRQREKRRKRRRRLVHNFSCRHRRGNINGRPLASQPLLWIRKKRMMKMKMKIARSVDGHLPLLGRPTRICVCVFFLYSLQYSCISSTRLCLYISMVFHL
uniref:Uncharacterized protein n=1 Tax=Oryza brachyantha TaxID=4533 RepID=J3MAQ6_ORYBR